MKKILYLIEALLAILLLRGISLWTSFAATTNPINYKHTIIYLWEENEELNLWFQQNFDKTQTQFLKIFLSEKPNFGDEEIMSKINENIENIKKSEKIIINTNNFDVLFQLLSRTNNLEELNLKQKEIYFITNTNKFFLKRMLAKYIKNIGVEKIYTIPKDEILNFLSTLSLNKITNQEVYITPFSLTFQETPKLLLISYLVDNLISNGFPIDLIGILLILAISALVVSIFRQVIWFSVFWIYSPILFALSMAVLWVQTSLWLLFTWFIAKIITSLFCKRIYLLHNAKTTFLIMLYFLIIITVIGLDNVFKTNFVSLNIFTTMFSLFPIVFIIIVTDKVFNDGFKTFTRWRRVSFAEFLIVSFSVRGLINRSSLKHVLLSYPESIIIILILNIIVGRFTGLQVLEYLRFMPLIKRHLDSEEE